MRCSSGALSHGEVAGADGVAVPYSSACPIGRDRAGRRGRCGRRTVRDTIPHSRLAAYADYEYDEERERWYASEVRLGGGDSDKTT